MENNQRIYGMNLWDDNEKELSQYESMLIIQINCSECQSGARVDATLKHGRTHLKMEGIGSSTMERTIVCPIASGGWKIENKQEKYVEIIVCVIAWVPEWQTIASGH